MTTPEDMAEKRLAMGREEAEQALLDQFAMAALTGLISDLASLAARGKARRAKIAALAYLMADEMMEARKW